VRHATTVRTAFEAGHSVDGHSMCGWVGHGHHWEVEVTVAGGLDPKKVLVVDHGELAEAVRRIGQELDGHSLNDMLPGVVSTPEGVGLYFKERLILDWPLISAIRVAMTPNINVTITMETR